MIIYEKRNYNQKKADYIREGRSMDISETIDHIINLIIKLKNNMKTLLILLMILTFNLSNAQSGEFMGVYEGTVKEAVGKDVTHLKSPVKVTIGDYIIGVESKLVSNERFLMYVTNFKVMGKNGEFYFCKPMGAYSKTTHVSLSINSPEDETCVEFEYDNKKYVFNVNKIR